MKQRPTGLHEALRSGRPQSILDDKKSSDYVSVFPGATSAESQQSEAFTIRTASLLAEAILFLHLLWCGWVLLGWTLTRCRPMLRTLHIASLLYAIVIELLPWPLCLLTVAETRLEVRAGIEPERGPFLVRVLDATVYPDLPEWFVVGSAVLGCVAILWVYLRRYRGRTADGQW